MSLSDKIDKLKVYCRADQQDFESGENMRDDMTILFKEFVKKLKEELCYEMSDEDSGRGNMDGVSQPNIWAVIDKLAGDRLI